MSITRVTGESWRQQTGTNSRVAGESWIQETEAAGAAFTYYRTISDDSNAGAWTASTGTDMYAMIDETSPSASDYIESPNGPSAAVVRMKLG